MCDKLGEIENSTFTSDKNRMNMKIKSFMCLEFNKITKLYAKIQSREYDMSNLNLPNFILGLFKLA